MTASPDEAAPVPGATASKPTGAPDRAQYGAPTPEVAFTAPDGRRVTLAVYRGKPVLLNIWATWCGPCVKEMPTLDRLAADPRGVQLLAVSQDMDGAAKVAPYWRKAGFKTLRPSLDPALGLSLAYRAELPMTVLIDSAGKEVWRIAGARDWTTPASRALIAEAR